MLLCKRLATSVANGHVGFCEAPLQMLKRWANSIIEEVFPYQVPQVLTCYWISWCRSKVTFVWSFSRFWPFRASGDRFCQYCCGHLFVVEVSMFHKCIFLKLQSVYQNNNLSPYRYVVKATAVMLKRVEICVSILCKIFRLSSVKHMFETLYMPFV